MAPRPAAQVADWQTVDPGDWSTVTESKGAITQPQGSGPARFAGGAWDTTIGGLGKAIKTLYHFSKMGPGQIDLDAIQDAHDLVQSQLDQAKKAKESWGQGEHVEAFGHGLAAALPLVGPAAAHAGERMGGSAPEFDKYGSVVKQGAAPDVAGGLGEAAGLIVGSSPRNITKPLAKGTGAVFSKVVPERLTPEGMYQSALRPGLAKKNIPKIKAKVATGINEGIPVTKGGLAKLEGTVDDINSEITDEIDAASDSQGRVVNPLDVTKPVNRLKPTFSKQVNPDADMAAINKSKSEFLRKHTTEAPYTKIEPGIDEPGFVAVGEGVTKTKQPLTLSEAQSEKQGTYRQLRKKYGELGSADVEAQKALARGLKDEIAKRVPGISELNAREGGLLELQTELERMVAREGNKNLLGLVPATMARNPYGFLATLMMDNPAVKSHIAIALSRARKLNGGNAAATAGVAAVGGDSTRDVPHFAMGGIIKHPTHLVDVKSGKVTGLMAEAGPEAIVPLASPDPIPVHNAISQLSERFRIKFPRIRTRS